MAGVPERRPGGADLASRGGRRARAGGQGLAKGLAKGLAWGRGKPAVVAKTRAPE